MRQYTHEQILLVVRDVLSNNPKMSCQHIEDTIGTIEQKMLQLPILKESNKDDWSPQDNKVLFTSPIDMPKSERRFNK